MSESDEEENKEGTSNNPQMTLDMANIPDSLPDLRQEVDKPA